MGLEQDWIRRVSIQERLYRFRRGTEVGIYGRKGSCLETNQLVYWNWVRITCSKDIHGILRAGEGCEAIKVLVVDYAEESVTRQRHDQPPIMMLRYRLTRVLSGQARTVDVGTRGSSCSGPGTNDHCGHGWPVSLLKPHGKQGSGVRPGGSCRSLVGCRETESHA